MIQHLIVAAVFIMALVYVARLVYRQFAAKSGCASGCAKCSAVDFEKIEQQLSKKPLFKKS